MLTRIGRLSVGVCLALLWVTSAAVGAEKTLRIGNEGDFRPFAFKDAAGKLQGFDIDIANEICKHLKTECEFVVQDFKGMIPALHANRFDLVVSSMTITEERRKQVLFSAPYYQSVYAFIARADNKFEISKPGLKGKRIGVVSTGAQRKWLEATYGDVIELKLYDKPADVQADMRAGRIDGTIATMPFLYGAYLEKDDKKQFTFVGEPLRDPKWFGEGVGIAARLGDKELIERVNTAVKEIYADGTFRKINDKYFPFSIGN